MDRDIALHLIVIIPGNRYIQIFVAAIHQDNIALACILQFHSGQVIPLTHQCNALYRLCGQRLPRLHGQRSLVRVLLRNPAARCQRSSLHIQVYLVDVDILFTRFDSQRPLLRKYAAAIQVDILLRRQNTDGSIIIAFLNRFQYRTIIHIDLAGRCQGDLIRRQLLRHGHICRRPEIDLLVRADGTDGITVHQIQTAVDADIQHILRIHII